MFIVDTTVVLIVICTLLCLWGMLGFMHFGEQFKNDPIFDPTVKQCLYAGPAVWFILLYIEVYNFFLVKNK